MFALTQTTLNNNETVQTVDARQLHAFLGVSRDFTTWIKGRISEYGFVHGVDYLLTKSGGQVPHQGGLRSVTISVYHLTVDMAKELSMVEKTDKGREARRYFIECEKQLMQEHKARQGVQLELHKQILALEAQDKTTFQFASWGSKKMNERKKSIKAIRSERERLFKEAQVQLFDAE